MHSLLNAGKGHALLGDHGTERLHVGWFQDGPRKYRSAAHVGLFDAHEGWQLSDPGNRIDLCTVIALLRIGGMRKPVLDEESLRVHECFGAREKPDAP